MASINFTYNQQIIAITGESKIGSFPTFGKLNIINSTITTIIAHRILAKISAEDIGIGTVATNQYVIARSTD